MVLLWILVLVFEPTLSQECEQVFTIATFNIYTFGPTKASNTEVLETISKVVHRNNIILLHGIEDSSGDAFETLMENVNLDSDEYAYSLSERNDDPATELQYAFVYKSDQSVLELLNVTNTYASVEVTRRPFSALFRIAENNNIFAVIGVNIHGDAVVEDLNALPRIQDELAQRWNVTYGSMVIAGDLKADSPYLTQDELNELTLRTESDAETSKFIWLVGDDVDTTVSTNSERAYDRVIISGQRAFDSVIPGTVKPFHFDDEYGLNEEEAKNVSYRYPIEMGIGRCSVDTGNATSGLSASISIGICLILQLFVLINRIGN